MDKRDILLGVSAIALITCAATISFMEPPKEGPQEVPPVAEATVRPSPESTPAAEPDRIEAPADSSSELWSDDESLHRIKPLAVALDTETQWAIYEACGNDPGLFALVIAIAEHESGFDPQMVGDGGNSQGMMQINTRWHTGRMEALGVTDLTDPVQCAAVSIDYIQELVDSYGFEPESEALLIAYNCGPGGARRLIDAGKTSTTYSQEVITAYQGYLDELGGQTP